MNAEAERARLEAAVVEAALEARRLQRAYSGSIPFSPVLNVFHRKVYEASKALEAAVDALERHLAV